MAVTSAATAYLGTSGQVLIISTATTAPAPNPVVPAGQVPVVIINGVPTQCPNFCVIGSDVVVLLPAALDPTAVLSVAVPGATAAPIPVVNNTGVATIPPQKPTGASLMVMGMNPGQPNYYCGAPIWADLMRISGFNWSLTQSVPAGTWETFGGKVSVTVDSRGWPSSITGGPTTDTWTGENLMISDPVNPAATIVNYLLRWLGGSEPFLGGPPVTLGATGVALDGWSWRVVGLPAGLCTGIRVTTGPIKGIQLLVAGSFNASTGMQTATYDPRWTAAYGGMGMRWMGALGVNSSSDWSYSDAKPSEWFKDSLTGRTVTGAVTACVPGKSVYLNPTPGQPVWLITHNLPANTLVTGQIVTITTPGNTWLSKLIEVVSPTQFRVTQVPVAPPVGSSVSVQIAVSYAPEVLAEYHNDTGEYCWWNVGTLAEPARIADEAKRLLNIRPGVPIYVEMGNELWAEGSNYQAAHCLGLGLLAGLTGTRANLYGMAMVTAECHNIFRAVFSAAGRSSDLRCVFANQDVMDVGNAQFAIQQYLKFTSGVYPDVYATAPYYGTIPSAWWPLLTPDGILDLLERGLTVPYGHSRVIAMNQQIVAGTPMTLATYEMNYGAGNNVPDTPSVNNAVLTALMSPRLVDQHLLSWNMLAAGGFKLNNHFAGVGPRTAQSPWPAQRWVGDVTPTMTALRQWVSAQSA